MAKEPNELKWVESLLPDDFRRKAMFGGFAYYLDEKMVLAMFESTGGSRTYKGTTYEFELWNGCMFPVEREHQDKALERCPFLVSHPILPKWLYLPLHTEGFDDLVTEVLGQAVKPTSYWGSIPKGKSKKGKARKEEVISTKIDTTTPRMFSDAPVGVSVQEILKKAVRVSDLKNLGPSSEAEFRKAGIKGAQEFIKLGWKKTMLKLIAVNPKNRHSMWAYALIGALTNREWVGISAEEKQEARDFIHALIKAGKEKKSKKVSRKKPVKKKNIAKKKTLKKSLAKRPRAKSGTVDSRSR